MSSTTGGTDKRSFFVAMLVSLSLCGCVAEQKQQLAKCDLDAARAYPEPSQPSVAHERALIEYVIKCMAASGYEFHGSFTTPDNGTNCERGGYRHTNPYCYAPMSPIGKWLFRLETGERID
jgi:hypothetical protein